MNFVTINEKAAAQALDFVVGPDVRVGIERLYELLAGAMEASYDDGFSDAMDSDRVEDDKREAWSDGYDIGYEHAKGEVAEDDESEGFYDASDEDEVTYEVVDPLERDFVISTDECNCESCSVERAEGELLYDALPPMQEQGLSPFAWSPGPVAALRACEERFND